MINRIALLVISLSLMLVSCDSTSTDNEAINIRIQNRSSYDMNKVSVRFPEEEVLYGSIAPGEITEFKSVTKAYPYAYIEMEVNGEKVKLQPIDYVGETLLEVGEYTYQLDLKKTEKSFHLMLSLRNDNKPVP